MYSGNHGKYLQIFKLHGSSLAEEAMYAMQLEEFRTELKTVFKRNEIERQSGKVLSKDTLVHAFENYFRTNKLPANKEIESVLEEIVNRLPYLAELQIKNHTFMDTFDIAITQPKDFEDCKVLIDLAYEKTLYKENSFSTYSQFCHNIRNIFNELGLKHQMSAASILNTSLLKLDFQVAKNEEEIRLTLNTLYQQFEEQVDSEEKGNLDPHHVSHSTYLKLNDTCDRLAFCYVENKGVTSYLQRLYIYLKAFSKVFYAEGDNSQILSQGKSVSYFEILKFNRAELMGKLLFEMKLNPSNYEQYFSKLKLSLLYHIVGNCFPTINLHQEDNVPTEEMYPENRLFVPDENLIDYIQRRNWLLAYILNEMYNIRASTIDVHELRIQNFVNYMQLPRIQQLKVLFNGSELIAALQNEINPEKTIGFLNKMMLKKQNDQMTDSSTSSGSNVEPGEEMLEENLKTTDWKLLYDILESIPENQLRKSSDYLVLKDLILENIVTEQWEAGYYKYVRKISNRTLRVEMTLQNFKYWPLSFCIDVISAELSHLDNPHLEVREELEIWLKRLEIYEKVRGNNGTVIKRNVIV